MRLAASSPKRSWPKTAGLFGADLRAATVRWPVRGTLMSFERDQSAAALNPEADTAIVASRSFRLLPERLVVTFSKLLGPSIPKVALGQNQKSCDLLNVVDLVRPETAGL